MNRQFDLQLYSTDGVVRIELRRIRVSHYGMNSPQYDWRWFIAGTGLRVPEMPPMSTPILAHQHKLRAIEHAIELEETLDKIVVEMEP